MRFTLILFLLISLPACAQAAPLTPAAITTQNTQVTLNALPTVTPSALPSSTPQPNPSATLPCGNDPGCSAPAAFPLSYPILPPANDRIAASYPFGTTRGGTVEVHHGVEFVNPSGTPVYAAADGEVLFAGKDDRQAFGPFKGYYGSLVILEHRLPSRDEPIFTLYGHLSKVSVTTGQKVSVGDLVGEVGLSGVADGAHLHFEIRAGSNDYAYSVNPELYLPPQPEEFSGAPAGILLGLIANPAGEPLNVRLTITRVSGEGPTGQTWFPELYGAGVMSDAQYRENFLVSGLREGRYRLVFYYKGRYYDQTVDVLPDKITSVVMTTQH